jgi:hypothetical protein
MPLGRLTATLILLTWSLIISLSPDSANANGQFEAQYKPVLQISPAEGEIHIDGRLDEPAWKTAAVAENFAETYPGDQVEPPCRSEALVTYDRNMLYIALLAYDDPKTIRASMCDRDNIFQDDYFGFMLDTYGDASWGYEFFVNPYGIQGDLRMLANGNEEIGFDVVWESKGQITDSGYQVEIAIPFTSLRFPNKEEQAWRINFWRDRQRDVRRKFAWAAIDRDNACFMCQWGMVTGIRNIRPASNLEILPNIIASQASALESDYDPKSRFVSGNADVQASLNVRYGLTSNSSAEVTVNPDFSQVESDATQIDVNSPWALFYEERRPFFQEGGDLFSSYINTVYTRSISSPQVAAKLTGRFGRYNVAYLLARDDASPIVIPLAEQTAIWGNGKSTSNIVRVKRTFGDESFIGGFITDRRLDHGGSGSVVGGDARIRLIPHILLGFQALASRTVEPNDTGITSGAAGTTFENGRHTVAFDGERFWGHAATAILQRDGRTWSGNVQYTEYSPTFRVDNGFLERNDIRQVEMWNGLTFRPNGKWMQTWQPSLDIARVWNFDGIHRDGWVLPQLQFGLRGQTTLNLNYLWSQELYRSVYFPGIRRGSIAVDTRPSGNVGLGGQYTAGHSIARSYSLLLPVLGRETIGTLYGDFRPTVRLALEPSFKYTKMLYPDRDQKIYEVYIFRTRLSYQFSREWFLRLVVEYTDYNEFSERDSAYHKDGYLTVEPLLSFKMNPFTIFYIGSTHGYWDHAEMGYFTRSSQRFFAKLQYLFRV